jgi:hypothetical protein
MHTGTRDDRNVFEIEHLKSQLEQQKKLTAETEKQKVQEIKQGDKEGTKTAAQIQAATELLGEKTKY